MAGSQQLDDATEISSAELKELTPKRASAAPASFPKSTADLQPMLEALRLKAMPSFNQAASFVREQVATAGLRLQQDTLFSTLEDFERVDPDAKRIVVIGVTGAGKSTVLNCMGGWGFVQKPPDYEFEWQEKDGVSPLFEARADCDSCTKKTSFANLSFLGDAERPVVAVDTPGHDDPAGAEIENKEAREKLGEMAADLHNKMKALGHIHAILVLHNDVHSNRLNPATYTVLKMIGEKFAKAEASCWKHVVVAYSKCNAHETSWRSGLAKKKKDLQAEIRSKVEMCDHDVPVIALGGGSIDPAPPVATEVDSSDGFEALWRFVQEAAPLDTSTLQPFEGADVKWQKIIDAKDEVRPEGAAYYLPSCSPLLRPLTPPVVTPPSPHPHPTLTLPSPHPLPTLPPPSPEPPLTPSSLASPLTRSSLASPLTRSSLASPLAGRAACQGRDDLGGRHVQADAAARRHVLARRPAQP